MDIGGGGDAAPPAIMIIKTNTEFQFLQIGAPEPIKYTLDPNLHRKKVPGDEGGRYFYLPKLLMHEFPHTLGLPDTHNADYVDNPMIT